MKEEVTWLQINHVASTEADDSMSPILPLVKI